jgi:hypothetical protein
MSHALSFRVSSHARAERDAPRRGTRSTRLRGPRRGREPQTAPLGHPQSWRCTPRRRTQRVRRRAAAALRAQRPRRAGSHACVPRRWLPRRQLASAPRRAVPLRAPLSPCSRSYVGDPNKRTQAGSGRTHAVRALNRVVCDSIAKHQTAAACAAHRTRARVRRRRCASAARASHLLNKQRRQVHARASVDIDRLRLLLLRTRPPR